MLDISGLNVFHGNIHVVWDLKLTVDEGEMVTLIGPNGAGKTSTVETIIGINRNATGSITFLGENILGLHPFEIFKKGLALVPEKREIFPKMPVIENLHLGAGDRTDWEARLQHIYNLFPILHERERQTAGTLSGGEQQMLAIGRALMGRPTCLMLDEPSLGIAPLLVELIFERLVALNRERGMTMLLVEQNASLALKVSSYAYVLETGGIHLEGPSAELINRPEIKEAYLGH